MVQVYLEGAHYTGVVPLPDIPSPGDLVEVHGSRPMGRDRRMSQRLVVRDMPVEYRVVQREDGSFGVTVIVKVTPL